MCIRDSLSCEAETLTTTHEWLGKNSGQANRRLHEFTFKKHHVRTTKPIYITNDGKCSNGTTHTPYGILSPKIGGSQPPPRISIAIISGTGRHTDLKFGRHMWAPPNESPLKFWRKGSVDISRDCAISWHPLLPQEWVKLRSSNFIRTFIGPIETKPIKIG